MIHCLRRQINWRNLSGCENSLKKQKTQALPFAGKGKQQKCIDTYLQRKKEKKNYIYIVYILQYKYNNTCIFNLRVSFIKIIARIDLEKHSIYTQIFRLTRLKVKEALVLNFKNISLRKKNFFFLQHGENKVRDIVFSLQLSLNFLRLGDF